MGAERGRSFESWRLRVRSRDGSVLGAGVLLGDRTVLTCAHLLPGGGEVVVDFVGHPDVPSVVARTVPGSVVAPGPDQRGDVAWLLLDQPVDPRFGTSLRRAALSWDRPVRAFGFPAGLENGVWSKFVLAAEAGPAWEWVQMNLRPGEHPVRRGFSGAGVSDEETGEVLGIVGSFNRRESTGLSWMLPADTILSHLPELEPFGIGGRSVDPRFDAPFALEVTQVETARRITGWLEDGRDSALLVVVGEEVTALRRAVVLASRELRPTVPADVLARAPSGTVPALGSVDLAVDATNRTADETTHRILDRAAVRTDALSAPREQVPPMTVVIDGVDDAAEPDELVEEVAKPLVARGVRVVLAFRREASSSLAAARGWQTEVYRRRVGALAERITELAAAERDTAALRTAVDHVEATALAARMRIGLTALRSTGPDESRLASLERRAEEALRQAREVNARLTAGLAERDELRGLLGAHKAFATDAGLAEDIALGQLHRQAHDLLWRAPVDLGPARAAVGEYGRAVMRRVQQGRGIS